MSLIIGLAGASRNGAVAVCDGGRVIGMCEHERVTRTRREGLPPGKLPAQTLAMILRKAPSDPDVATCTPRRNVPSRCRRICGSSTSIAIALTQQPRFTRRRLRKRPSSSATGAAIRNSTVWVGDERGLRRSDFDWRGPGFATIYSRVSEAMGFGRDGEAKVEALARIGAVDFESNIPAVRFRGDHLDVPADFDTSIDSAARADGRAALALHVQRQLGGVLLDVVASIQRYVGGANLCLGGGLFDNSFFNTALAGSGSFANSSFRRTLETRASRSARR